MIEPETSLLQLQLNVCLRLARKEDIPRLEWFGQYRHFRHLFRRAFREQQEGRRLLLLADCNNFPIGQIFVQLASQRAGVADGSARAYFYSLRVMPMFRRQGIGTRLILEAENRVRARGFTCVTIAVAKNNEAARRLYERLHYRIFREDEGKWSYIDHQGERRHVHEPCWLLEKFLTMHYSE